MQEKKFDWSDITKHGIFILAVVVILFIIGIIAYSFYYDMTHECTQYKTVRQTRCNENGGYTSCWTEDVKVCEKYAE